MLHCWENGPSVCVHDPKCDDECLEGMSTTCMAEKDHLGDHEFMRDDQITIKFAESEKIKEDTDAGT